MQIWFQSFFSKCVNMPLLTHFEKECVFFKVRWLGSKFNALWNFVSKCANFQMRCNNPDLCRYNELHNSMCDINLQSPDSNDCKKKIWKGQNLYFLISCWLKFDKPLTYIMFSKIFLYVLMYAAVVLLFTKTKSK